MEYFINVYQATSKTPYTETTYSKAAAKYDVERTIRNLSEFKYIHTIHVTDDHAVVVDLRGDKS